MRRYCLNFYRQIVDEERGEKALQVSLSGRLLLDYPLLNKSSAFPEDERREFGLLGLLPPHVSTMEEQLTRVYENYKRKETDLERYIFLISLQDRNETLFYRLLEDHIEEMVPIIYTPTVGVASQYYSHIFRRSRGLYLSYSHRAHIDEILANAPNDDVRVIVVTDGERILGLGDLGVGGMGIPVGKLSLYTLCAGIHPATTLPIFLDVGTDNQDLLKDPIYLGWRHPRVRGAEYDDFIEAFIQGVLKRFPKVLLQWEDFARHNAKRLLEKYQDRLCTFNDDIQGTGAVTVAALLSAVKVLGEKLYQQRIAMFGAGSAATGIAEQMVAAMVSEGAAEKEAKANLWLIDIGGLIHTGRNDLEELSAPYAQPRERLAGWHLEGREPITLAEVVRHLQPTVLIGTTAQFGAFTEDLVREMARHVARPIILPLSNPTSRCEAKPADLLRWTSGGALVATGSPFPEVPPEVAGSRRPRQIGQCNNAYIFPGVGLGVLASGARRVTQEMFIIAAKELSAMSPALADPMAPLFPPLKEVREVSRRVALKVALEAQDAGLADETTPEELEKRIDETMWLPRYVRYRKSEADEKRV
jgi:malate dehydrogenase (oxaloacetate-decarboxylating)